MADLLPDRIDSVVVAYWESIYSNGWANTFWYPIYDFFSYQLPNGIRLDQKIRFEMYNVHSELDLSNSDRNYIERFLRPYKSRYYPLVLINDMRPGISIDSQWRFDNFCAEFSDKINAQFFGRRVEPVAEPEQEAVSSRNSSNDAQDDTPPRRKKFGIF